MLRYENYEYSSCGTSHGLMKSTATRISSKSSVPDNCIIPKGEVLEYRDSLTQVFRLPNKVIPEFWKGEMKR